MVRLPSLSTNLYFIPKCSPNLILCHFHVREWTGAAAASTCAVATCSPMKNPMRI